MLVIPQRQPLVAQTVACLSAEIDGGRWSDWLPSERLLCEMFQVSRNTLRAALAQMHRDGIIVPMHGSGNRIVARPAAKAARQASHDVAFLLPDPLERLRPTLTLWIDELRALLNERGCGVHLFHGSQFFRTHPAQALEKLVSQNPHGCWIPVLSNEAVQRWFLRSRLPCVIAGTCHPEIELSYVDLDHRAMCRHAAGVLLGLGHRRIVFLNQRSPRAGDLESEEGFVAGVSGGRYPNARGMVVHHEPTPENLFAVLRRLMGQKNRPTALLVANPYFYLTVTSRLAQLGWRVPGDISVLSRDEDPFLSFLAPTPSRYAVPAHIFARRLLRSVLNVLGGGTGVPRSVRIMPDFIRGESIGPPSSAA